MSPRELAFDVLCNWQPQGTPATAQLDARLREVEFSSSERALATELVHGMIRRRATLDVLVAAHSKRPLRQIEPDLRMLLHLGLYQLVFLSGAPTYAVVHETVELAKRLGHPEWTGFVNALLRTTSRNLTPETVDRPAPNAVPLVAGKYRRLEIELFPDPEHDLDGYFAAAFSFPAWLTERWAARFSADELLRLGFWFDSVAAPALRVNTLATSREALLKALCDSGIEAHPGEHPDAVRLASSTRVTALPGFQEGWFAVQDESAMGAASLLAPMPGENVLDLCAAPGGKTAHLAALMGNSGSILACDVSTERVRLIEDSCRRLGTQIVTPRLVRRGSDDVPGGPFDAALVDVPCSNTGVLGKRPEARWRLRPADVAELTELQRRLLEAALSRLRPGGRLVYSTCSIEPEENERVVAAALREHPGLKLVEERRYQPGQPADGGYQALLRIAGD